MLNDALTAALDRRTDLIHSLKSENTTCYRLLHGATEGVPGVTIDRYGPIALVQSWREAPSPEDLAAVQAALPDLTVVHNHRRPSRGRSGEPDFDVNAPVDLPDEILGTEQGLSFNVHPRHGGHDALVYLDLRAGRRLLRTHAKGKSVLNLFAYTGVAGLAAAAAGASEVWNIDFAAAALSVSTENAARAGLSHRLRDIKADCLPAIRQLAGLPPGGRRGKRPPFRHFLPRTFDIVVLDPPRWARSSFGAVDVVRDYPTLLKPALLATVEGGHLLVTNHVSTVSWDDWIDVVQRCATKAGRPVKELTRVTPEGDFPSPDNNWPLKMAWLSL